MPALRLAILDDLSRIGAAAWDALLAADAEANPFLSYAFLHALQASGSATADTGWAPCHLTLWQGETLVAAVPLYAKGHSYGEYVFDWAWADAMQRAGGTYYPKWLVAVPFTPVTGSRFLARDDAARTAAMAALDGWLKDNPLSSAHILFVPPGQQQALKAAGWMMRESIQFHWRNAGFAGFDDFLGSLRQDKRKKIRAERRKVAQAGVRLVRRLGPELSAADWEFFYRCYEGTYLEHGNAPYLTRDFFRRLSQSMPEHLLLVLAYCGDEPVASALAVLDRRRGYLYGRYWGAIRTIECLHFECCYYQMIEFAIEQRLACFEGGAQGAHKLARGLDPVRTHSAHRITHAGLAAAVERFLEREHLAVDANLEELNEHRAWAEWQARPAANPFAALEPSARERT